MAEPRLLDRETIENAFRLMGSISWTGRRSAKLRCTKAGQQRRIDLIPDIVGQPLIDTLIGAAGEHLAQRWGLRVPTWTQRSEHFALDKPHFHA